MNGGKTVGTFSGISALQPPVLPALPTPWEDVMSPHPSTASISSGKAFYVPPETYADPNVTLVPHESLNVLEECGMRIELRHGDSTVASRRFLLRRPPLVLVHGIMSGPATWDPTLWDESPGSLMSTRVYKADWSATGTLGYGENYGTVALAIDAALAEYRQANDNGHGAWCSFHGVRYAATRADLVCHSQGGQLARFYVADGMPELINRIGWLNNLSNMRAAGDPDGHWPYLRDDNYGAGSINRLITLGSPFKGSPKANQAAAILASGERGEDPPAGNVALTYWYGEGNGGMPVALQDLLFPNGVYVEPTCCADLCVGSDAQQALEAADYPAAHRQVRWYPIVGIATQGAGSAPVQSTLWQLLFNFIPAVPTDPPIQISPGSPTSSDLIVPADSQRNSSPGSPNEFAGADFEGTAHVNVPGVVPGETSSASVRDKVRSLLWGWPTSFSATWRLGQ
ncbi:MAG: hypothetical protein U0572_13665 [Phycisphaerales bacterium]